MYLSFLVVGEGSWVKGKRRYKTQYFFKVKKKNVENLKSM